jgi:hypothetical protein
VSSRKVMQEYLRAIGQLPMSIGGPEMCGPPLRKPSSEEVNTLRKTVEKQIATNRIVLWFGLAMVFVVLVAALFVTFKQGATTGAVLRIAGVGSAVEAGLLAWVLRLWSEYNKFVFLLMLSQGLSPEEFTKVVLSMFLSQNSTKWRRMRAVKASS